jgi:hypothetical protein
VLDSLRKRRAGDEISNEDSPWDGAFTGNCRYREQALRSSARRKRLFA